MEVKAYTCSNVLNTTVQPSTRSFVSRLYPLSYIIYEVYTVFEMGPVSKLIMSSSVSKDHKSKMNPSLTQSFLI